MPVDHSAEESDRHPTRPERTYTPLRTPLPVLPEAAPVPDDRQLLQQVLAAVNSLTETVKALSERVAFLEGQIPKDLDRKLERIQASLSKGDVSFATIEQKLSQLDKDFGAIAVRMTASEQDRAALRAKVSSLDTEIATLKNEVLSLKNEAASLKSEVTTLKSKAATDETHIMPPVKEQPHWAFQAVVTAIVTVVASATTIWWLQGIAQHAKP